MSNQLCFQCFHMKGDYAVCPHCGYEEGTEAAQAYQLAPGTVLRGRYIIGTSIGFGGFGITYKAFDTVLSVVVAIKEFYPAGLVNRGEGEIKVGVFSGEKEQDFKRQLARFLEEARNMAVFSKEKDIINVFDYFEENQTAYIIMEYVNAPLLKAKLKEKGRFEENEAIVYMKAILAALAKVHYHGIIHKDISPDNIFLTGADSVKIFDFGAAKFQGTETERNDAIVVKAGYTPPEQYRTKNEQGAFMDLYAAGAVFYEMVTGEKPMEAPDRSICDELKKPSAYGIAIEERIERVILKALALKPQLRFQTAEQFQKALESSAQVELPEETLKRQRLMKRLLAFGSLGATAVVAVVLLLSQTVFSGRGKIDVEQIAEDTVSIWLRTEEAENGAALVQTFLESVEKECPQLTVTAEAFAEDVYAQKVAEAAAAGTLPDVFCTDGIEAEAYCEELSKLLHTMRLSSYLYLEELADAGGVFALPAALQTGVVYRNEEKETDGTDAVELSLLKADAPDLGYASDEGVFAAFSDMESPVSKIAGDLSCMDAVRAVTTEAAPPTDFSVVPLLSDDAPIGVLKHFYGVNQNSSDNRKEAGMFLISLLLGDGMQSAAYMDNEAGIPLNRAVYEAYRETKMTTYLGFLKAYDPKDIKILEGDDVCQIIRNEIAGEEE